MHDYISLIVIFVAVAAGAMSPGPSFVYVARHSIIHSRKNGVMTALGMGTGAFLFSIFSLMGLQAVFQAVPYAFLTLKTVGGLYLLYVAFKMFFSARKPLINGEFTPVNSVKLKKSYVLGLITQLSNPKTAVSLASVFSTLLPKVAPTYFYFMIPVIVFMINAGWYTLVSLVLSAEKPRTQYLRYKTVFDRAAGSIMGLLGMKILVSSN